MKEKLKTKVQSLKTSWYIWMFPAFAVAVSGYLLYDYYRQEGPRIQISFEDAGAVQAEKTQVRFRGVAIGTVKDVHISEDQKSVIAEVILREDAKNFAVEGSKFSLVTPKVNFQGISGLETLIEGTYIAVLPGRPGAPEQFDFKAQSAAATENLDETSAYLVETDNAESIGAGDAVTFRGMKVGTVTKLRFNKGAQTIAMQVNIDNKYAELIRTNTVFWRKVGIQAKLGLFGSEIKLNSMESIMSGGLEFSTPEPAGARAHPLQKFTLASVTPKDATKWNAFLN